MKRYPEYKDSGVEWLGEIPKHWDCKMIKRLSPVKRGASPRPIDDPKYFDENGEFAWVRIADVSKSNKYLEQTTQRLSELGSSLSVKRYPNDFFISIAGTVGKPIISKIKCCIHDGFVYFPELIISPLFMYYIFETGLPYLGLGKLGTQLNLNTDTVGQIKLPIPSKEEIFNIATFLDQKTSQIDSLIANKKRMIDLLKEERAAIINHAVTKGINPDAEMKDSEVEWLGEVPKHWEVKKMKFVAQINPTKDESINKDSEELVTFLPMECVNADGSISTIQKKPIKSLFTGFTFFRKNDIIFAKITPCFENGKGALLTELETECGFGSTEFHVLRAMPNRSNDKFLYFYTISPLFRDFGEAFMTGSAGQKRVPTDFVENFLIPNPTIQEQKSIVSFLEKKTSQIDSSITHIEKEISLIEEYRTALINETVTGKIDIRDKVKG